MIIIIDCIGSNEIFLWNTPGNGEKRRVFAPYDHSPIGSESGRHDTLSENTTSEKRDTSGSTIHQEARYIRRAPERYTSGEDDYRENKILGVEALLSRTASE